MAWAKRHQIVMTTRMPEERIIRVVLVQENSAEEFYLQGQFDQYKELPPVWDWRDADWSDNGGTRLSPHPHNNPLGRSMFIEYKKKPVICAHFNRLAFKTHDGPHANWGTPAQWMSARKGDVYAVTIGDMLQSILRDFHCTEGRMG